MHTTIPNFPPLSLEAFEHLNGRPLLIAPDALRGYLQSFSQSRREPRRGPIDITKPPQEYLDAITGRSPAPRAAKPASAKPATKPATKPTTANRPTAKAKFDAKAARRKVAEARFEFPGPVEMRCVHEAGHLVAAAALGLRTLSATVAGNGQAIYAADPRDVDKIATIKAAGAVAETLIGGTTVAMAGTDYSDAVQAVGIVGLVTARNRAETLLASKRDVLLDLACELLAKQKLTESEIWAVLKRHGLR